MKRKTTESKLSNKIDSAFSKIQKEIFECKDISEHKKDSMLDLCIEFNDMLIRILEDTV